jgi:N-acetyl-anhydromuramyl-L-alanine amidase AmpD
MAHQLIDIRKTIPRHKTRKWKKRYTADKIVVHTTASNNQDPNKTARYHITPGPNNHLSKKGAPSLSYHDFITKSGIVYHCNDYTDITWHARLYNRRAVGVAMAFQGQTGESPCESQLNALEEHLTVLCLYLKILPQDVMGHREVPGMWELVGNGIKKYKKTCPGFGVDLDELRDNITHRLQRRLSSEGLYRSKIDGIFGLKSKLALQLFEPEARYLKVRDMQSTYSYIKKVKWKKYR